MTSPIPHTVKNVGPGSIVVLYRSRLGDKAASWVTTKILEAGESFTGYVRDVKIRSGHGQPDRFNWKMWPADEEE